MDRCLLHAPALSICWGLCSEIDKVKGAMKTQVSTPGRVGDGISGPQEAAPHTEVGPGAGPGVCPTRNLEASSLQLTHPDPASEVGVGA